MQDEFVRASRELGYVDRILKGARADEVIQ